MDKKFKSVSVHADTHDRLVEEADKRGMKIRELATRIINAGLNQKNFDEKTVSNSKRKETK